MRILILSGFAESIAPFRGTLIRELEKAGCEVHVAAPEVRRAALQDSVSTHDIPLVRTGTNPISDARLLVSLVRLMHSVRPDVVFGYNVKPVIYGSLAAWLTRVPRRFVLITGLGYAFTGGRRGPLSLLVRRMYAFALARIDKAFFQNPDDRDLLLSLGVVPAFLPTVVVNGSGVDVDHYAPAPMPPGEPSFLMIARLLGDKGVREYVDAARIVRRTHPLVSFKLAGWIDSNPDTISVKELDSWRSEGAIEFLGKLDDVRPAIAAATVFVLPSYREGTPRTVLEAMAMARPVITTNAPGCRETVVDGENGFLVPPRSIDALVVAMERLIRTPRLAVAMGRRSRQIAEEKYDVRKVNAMMLREMGIRPGGSDG